MLLKPVSQLSVWRVHHAAMRTILTLLLLLMLPPSFAQADEGKARDANRARQAVEQGEALPLAAILGKVGPELGGQIIGMTFKRKHERWIYEFRIVDAAGRMWEAHVDAATAAVLRREGH